jgi:hypothetical protein
LNDPELHSLDGEIAVITARIEQLLSQLKAAKAPSWDKVTQALNDLDVARSRGSKGKQAEALAYDKLARIIRRGTKVAARQEAIWDDLKDTISHKTRTTQVEYRRQLELGSWLPAADLLALLKGIMEKLREVIFDNVNDPKDARRMLVEVVKYAQNLLPPLPPRSRLLAEPRWRKRAVSRL